MHILRHHYRWLCKGIRRTAPLAIQYIRPVNFFVFAQGSGHGLPYQISGMDFP